MRRSIALCAASLVLPIASAGAQSAPAHSDQPPPQSSTDTTTAAPAASGAYSDAAVTAQPDSPWQALEDKVARQADVIDKQNALIAALKAKLAAAQRERR